MIYTVTGWFEIAQYDDKRAISIANLVESTWLYRYPRPIEIMYDQVSGFIGHNFRKFLIEIGYKITAKPSTYGNTMSNVVLKRIHQVIGNLVRIFNISQTYVDKNDPWTGILSAAKFVIFSTTKTNKYYSPGQLIFVRNMILPMKYRVDWGLIHQKDHTKINKGKIHKIDIYLTTTIKLEIISCSLNTMYTNMKH